MGNEAEKKGVRNLFLAFLGGLALSMAHIGGPLWYIGRKGRR